MKKNNILESIINYNKKYQKNKNKKINYKLNWLLINQNFKSKKLYLIKKLLSIKN